MKLLTTLNQEQCTEAEIANLPSRRAARVVLFDETGKIALLHVTKKGYYKLPGGGIDAGETIEQALHRECLEETGCRMQVVGELGRVMEYRRASNIAQESFVYIGYLLGEKGLPALTEGEQAMGFVVTWMSLDEGIRVTDEQAPLDETGKHILWRDGILLREAKIFLDQQPEPSFLATAALLHARQKTSLSI